MSENPVLVLQMQRMGDLILSFPLLGWLQSHYAGHPIWVMAEERFFTPLRQLSPSVVFFPPEAAPRMQGVAFHRVINLSHRPDAATLCGSLHSDDRYGAYTVQGNTYIAGDWALYRASIVHNNRYNRFHWSDLQLLDHMDAAHMPLPPLPTAYAATSTKVCLVVGASEKEKHPDAEFWGALARHLVERGLRPFFVGGKEEEPLGEAASRAAGLPASNMCGRFSLNELTQILRETRLCITPDTGPMHLAAWVGVPVLNISMGPVNPWETGPVAPGHTVVQARLSCAGCWGCARQTPLCHPHIQAQALAALAYALIRRPEHISKLAFPGIRVLQTARTPAGMYTLRPARPAPPTAREMLAALWQAWFLDRAAQTAHTTSAMHALCTAYPALAIRLQKAVLDLGHWLARHISGKTREAVAPEFWQQHPPLLRPFTGYMHLSLQNDEFSPAAWQKALRHVEALAALCRTV